MCDCCIDSQRYYINRKKQNIALAVGIFFDICTSMKTIQNINSQQSRRINVAILFLRIFIGGVILLHIIGKMQDYDNLILSYHRILGFDAPTSFAIITILEGVFAAMIILGVATRLAATMMLIVSVMAIAEALLIDTPDMMSIKLNFLYAGIYTTLIISGGGLYAFNVPNLIDKK